MRHKLLILLAGLMMTVASFAAKEEIYVLHEGFEGGIMPDSAWTQEYATGHQAWVVEAGAVAQYPAGAFAGEYSAALRNNLGQTQHYVTRLVSPVMDISETFRPILVFAHAQAQRTGDVDTLRVYYRTSSAERWIKLREYDQKITKWQLDTIALPAASTTYQIAFEGTDNFGRGIVLDEIIVRPEPTCEPVSNISTAGLTVNSATLQWIGSFDTDSFHVVLSKQPMTEAGGDVVLDVFVNDFKIDLTELEQNTMYYVYIQPNCGVETADWAQATFTTKNQVNVPYVQTFDKNYASGTVSHVDYWTHGTSLKKEGGDMEYMPFVNQNTTETGWKNYSYSSSTCLVFSGARNLSTDIPAGEYVYAATPEINVDDVKNLQVKFWGTVYNDFGDEYAGGLIVGVMTDPADFTTFVPVDTVYAKEQRGFDRYTVYFNNYQGEGKYIAFASNFVEKQNMFFLDDVVIDEVAKIADITDITISKRTALSFQLDANLNGNTSFRLILARDSVNVRTGQICFEPDSLPAGYIVMDNVYDNPVLPMTIALDSALAGHRWQLYVQPVKNADRGAMSLPTVLMVPMLWNGEELFTSFEENEACGTWTAKQTTNFGYIGATLTYPLTVMTTPQNFGSTVPAWPSCLGGDDYGHTGKKSVYLGKEQQEYTENDIKYHQQYGDYIALPQVDDLSNLMLQFYLRGYSASYTEISKVAVGVMSDPFDPSTFEVVAYCESPKAKQWVPCIVTFKDYKGTGKFPAIMADKAPKKYKYSSTSGSGGSYTTYKLSYQYVDDITLRPMEGCVMPTDVNAVASDTSVVVTWATNDMDSFMVVLSKSAAFKDTVQTIFVKDTNTCTFDSLSAHTMYYYNVTSICEDTTLVSLTNEVKTLCAFRGEPIPYVEDFESYTGGSSTKELPACWNTTLQKVVYSGSSESSTSWYPYIYSYEASAHAGKKSFYFYGYANSSSYQIEPKLDGKAQFFTLPMMSEDLNKLQVSFWMKAGGVNYVGDTVYVGVMSDPEDIATFDTIALVTTTAAYSEYIIRLDKYAGSGLYIAFAKTPRELGRGVYMDDFKVDYLADCEKIQGVTAGDFNDKGATISWTKGEATQWEMVVTKASVKDPAAAGTALISDTVINTMPFTIDFCPETNTQYFVYVRAICDETNKGDWSNEISFKTTCVAQSAGEYALIDFAETNFKTTKFPCWTVGRREGSTAVPSITDGSHLYMFNATTSEGAYAIMPPVDVDSINRLQVKFTAAGGTGAAYLRELTVGIITNPNDLSTFEAIETVKLPLVTTTISKANHAKNLEEAQTYVVRFNNYFGDYEGNYGKQIMFLSENGGVANYVYIYSMQVDTIQSCLEPVQIEEVEVNTYDATMAWDSISNAYNVQLLSAAKALLLDTVVAANSIKFDGLDMLTSYYMQVRTICGEGDTSFWSPMAKFTTQCPVAYELPYSENFDSYTAKTSAPRVQPNCWTTWYNGQDAVMASTAYCYINANAKKGTAGNGFYMGSTTGNAAGTTPAMQSVVVLPAMNGLQTGLLHFYAKAYTTTTGTRALKIGMTEFTEPYDSILSTVVWVDSVKDIAGKDWTYYTFDLSKYKGTGKHIVIMNYGGNTSATSLSTTAQYVYIDDIYVEKAPSCFRPLDATFQSATATSLTFSWKPQGEETQWDVMVVEKDSAKVDDFLTVDTTIAIMTGLQDSKAYDFYVRANCGAGDVSEWSAVASGQTLCRVNAEDAAWNFDDAATQVQSSLTATTTYKEEQCWLYGNKMNATYSYAPYIIKNSYSSGKVTSKYAYTDSCAYRFYSTATADGAYVVIPELIADLDTMQISFKGRAVYESFNTTTGAFTKYYNTYATSTYARSIKVGTVTDPYDMSTFEELTNYQFQEVTAAACSTKVEGDYWEDVTVSLYQTKGKYIVFLSEFGANNYAYIDNVKVEKESGLNMPTKLAVDEDQLTGYSIPVTWTSRATKFQVTLLNDKDSVLACDTISESAYTFAGLTPVVTYKVQVAAMNAEETEVSTPAKLTVTTPCVPYTKDEAKWDFKDASYAYTGSTSYLLPTCWDAGMLLGTSATYTPQAIANTVNYQYSREAYTSTAGATQDRALRLSNSTTTAGNTYAIMPELDINEDSTALHFWMRAAYFYPALATSTANRNKLSTANSAYEKNLVVGAIADETDMSTFVGLDTITYPYSWTSITNVFTAGDETGNDYWIEVVLPLKKYKDLGKLVFFYPTNGKTGYMFIDDVEVIDADFCTSVTSLRANSVTSNSANITWSFVGNDSVRLQLATDNEFSDVVVDSILVNSEGLFQTRDLKSATTYYARVMHFCSEEESSDWAMSSAFLTNYAIRFTEKFNEVRTYPSNWVRANSKLVEVFEEGKTPSPIAETATAAWLRSPMDADMYVTTGTYASTTTSTGENSYWLITPVIDLTQQTAEDSLMLSMDIRLTNNNNQLPYNAPAEDDKFIVAVSVDGGKTYARENATFWGFDATDDRNYGDFGAVAKTMLVDMSKYVGQSITIGFMMDSKYASGKGSSKNYVHMDNVQLNIYEKSEYARTILQWEDYEDDNFQMDADELIPGATTQYDKFEQSAGTDADRYTRMALTVVPEQQVEFAAAVCYGADYMDHNFNIQGATKSAEYKQKLTAASGADSTVILSLTVRPLIETKVEKTICQGDYYEFNGVKYYTNTIHTDTLVSVVTGCDSLNTLYLTVNAILTGTVEEHLCPGDSVEFGKYGKIGAAGTYVDTIKNALGCDSVATLVVYTHQADSSITRAVILQGEKYNKAPWQGLSAAGDYPVKLQTVWGCDSTATLHLMVAGVSLSVTDQITVEQLPYVVNDAELLPVGTAEGTYVRHIEVGDQNVTMTIIVGDPTGLHLVGADEAGVVKVIENNQLIIYKNGQRFNAVGVSVR